MTTPSGKINKERRERRRWIVRASYRRARYAAKLRLRSEAAPQPGEKNMRLINVFEKQVRVPFTADDWELYTSADDLKQACELAASALNAQLEAELARWMQGSNGGEFAPTRKAVIDAVHRFEPITRQHGDVGAQDTEPRNMIELALVRIAIAMGAVDMRL